MHLIIKLLVNAFGVFVFGSILKGVEVRSFGTAIIVAIVLALLNTFVKPIITFFSIPFIILTLGLFVLVINTIIVMLTDWLVEGLKIKNFWWALLFSVLMSLLNIIIF
ncbi:MAG TPA: phage holin family protein [Balneolaceae bacterium]|nr:phage holin family protein [Balneolaceae bacterium]